MLQDIRHAARVLRRSPGFATTTAVTLTVGLALSTALFAIVDAVFFRPLAVHAPHELVYLHWTPGSLRTPRPGLLLRADYEHFRDTPDAFVGMTAHAPSWARLGVSGGFAPATGELVAGDYFDVLGVKPILGRTFVADEDRLGNPDLTLVISHDLWTRRFGSRPDIVGRTVEWATSGAAAREATIIGVMPKTFAGVNNPWTPTQFWATFAQAAGERYARLARGPIARLRPGVTVEQARALITTKGRQWTRDRRDKDTYHVSAAADVRMPFDPQAQLAPARLTLSMILVVAIVLVVTTVNVGGLMSVRALGRSGEIFLRRALGATAPRLGLQLTVEGVLLAALSGGLALIVAGWLIDLFQHYTPERFAVAVTLDRRAALFAAALCLGVGVLVSIGPVLQGVRARLIDPLRQAVADSVVKRVLRSGLVLVQVALAAALVVVAVTHLTTLVQIERRDLGYDPRDVAALQVALRSPSPDEPGISSSEAERRALRARTFARALLRLAQETPGAQAAALTGGALPGASPGRSYYVALSQEAWLAGETKGAATETLSVSPNYFRTLRMRVLAGRDFDERDTDRAPKTAIVSEALAAQLWPGVDPIGRMLAVLAPSNAVPATIEWREVAGVVNEVSPVLDDRGRAPFVYLPIGQQWSPSAVNVLARVDPRAGDVATRLREAAGRADALAEILRATTVRQMLADVLYTRRLATIVLAASATIAIGLSLLGLYAVVAYSVERRVQEIGIRSVLGANRTDIVWLIIRDGLVIAGTGSVIGLAIAYAAIGATAGAFEGMPRLSAITATVVPFALIVLVTLAGYVPARRAANIDPVAALRAL